VHQNCKGSNPMQVYLSIMVDTTVTCTLHCTLPAIRMGARLILMAGGVDESLCAQIPLSGL
jgi:hypothetical protein